MVFTDRRDQLLSVRRVRVSPSPASDGILRLAIDCSGAGGSAIELLPWLFDLEWAGRYGGTDEAEHQRASLKPTCPAHRARADANQTRLVRLRAIPELLRFVYQSIAR